MKKILALLLCLILVLSVFSGCAKAGDRSNTLKIYNWADYIDESVLGDFKAFYDAKYNTDLEIIYDTFDTNETMYTKIANGREDYDLACPSEYIIEKMIKENLVLPLDKSIVEDSYNNNVPEFIRGQFSTIFPSGDSNLYSVGYMWGTVGILYNKNNVSLSDLEAKGWGILWDENYSGKIYMKDSIRDTFIAANFYAFEKEYTELKQKFENGEMSQDAYAKEIQTMFNRTDDDAIALIEKVLREQKDSVAPMYDVDFDKNAMVQGSADLDLAWSGDATWAIGEAKTLNKGVELGYYIPYAGTNIFFDGWIIPKYAKNTTAASEFVNFLLQPEIALRNMDYIGYTSVVSGNSDDSSIYDYAVDVAIYGSTEKDISYFFNGSKNATVTESMYPDKNKIISTAIMRDFGAANDKISSAWVRVKGNVLNTGVVVVIIVASVLAIAGGVLITIKKSKTKKKNKKKSQKRK